MPCPRCEYDLRGLPGDRLVCPECGEATARAHFEVTECPDCDRVLTDRDHRAGRCLVCGTRLDLFGDRYCACGYNFTGDKSKRLRCEICGRVTRPRDLLDEPPRFTVKASQVVAGVFLLALVLGALIFAPLAGEGLGWLIRGAAILFMLIAIGTQSGKRGANDG